MAVDNPGQRVLTFETALRNASRLGTYADLIVGMFESGAWRQYTTALGPERWRAHEFDYFLIACDARYEDIVRILGWDTVRAAQLAEAMMGEPSSHRRSLAEASAAWRSPTGPSLIEIAQRNDWLIAQRSAPTLKVAPVGERARVRARSGKAWEQLAREKRAARLKPQRPALDALIADIASRVPDPEALRYVIDQLRRRLHRGRPKGSRSSIERTPQWAADVAALNGDRKKLAARWRVSPETTKKRVQRLGDK